MKYQYAATVVNVHDGDTIRVDLDLGFGVRYTNVPLRLSGINAPELATDAGKASQAFLASQLPIGQEIVAVTFKDKKEKYGRYLADVYVNGVNINVLLVTTGHALYWDGTGPRP